MSQFADKDHPCVFCGGSNFTTGQIRAQHRQQFYADDLSFKDKLAGLGHAEVVARICNNCRHIDFFAPEFNPPQPG